MQLSKAYKDRLNLRSLNSCVVSEEITVPVLSSILKLFGSLFKSEINKSVFRADNNY